MISIFINLVIFLPLSFAMKSASNATNLDKLDDALYKGFSEVWPFTKQFPTISDLRMQRSDLYKGIVNDGPWTEYSLKRVIEKVLDGKDIRVLIVGESISAGANLGCRNNRRTFHYGLAKWWLKSIALATGSRLRRHQMAVGGVATNYFDRCWKEYVYRNETFDLILWEFAVNDANAVNQSKSLERFTISVARLKQLPGLLFVNFFRKNFFENYVSRKNRDPCERVLEELDKRHEKHEIAIENVAKYYGVTLIDLERAVCSVLRRNSTALGIQHMFSIDHPSPLAHAQMTFMLIHYLRANFADIVEKLKMEKKKVGSIKNSSISGFKRKLSSHGLKNPGKHRLLMKLHRKENARFIPKPLYLSHEETVFSDEPICWTAVLPNIHIKPKHDLFELNAKHSKSFKKITKIDWRDADERRFDSTGGYCTTNVNQTIQFNFTIPSAKEQSKWRVSLAIRNKFFGGDIKVSLRNYVKRKGSKQFEVVEILQDIIDSSTKKYSGLNVYDLSEKTGAGNKTLEVTTVTGGVQICGIILS